MLHPIQYKFILGKRPEANKPIFVVSEELINDKLIELGLFPHTFEHLVMGSAYYQSIINTGESTGFMGSFIYTDSIDMVDLTFFPPSDQPVNVYFICTKDVLCLDQISYVLRKKHNKHCLYLVDEFHKKWFNWDNVFDTPSDAINYLKLIAPKIIDFTKIPTPYSVPDIVKDIDNGNSFKPSIINTLTSHSVLRDWNFQINQISEEEKANDAKEACIQKDSFNRQNILTEQILKLNTIESNSLYPLHKNSITEDQVRAPLIIVLPFTSSDIRLFFKDQKIAEFKSIQKAIKYVLSQPTDRNYTLSTICTENSELNPVEIGAAYNYLYYRRSHFLDIVGQLHASFKFSPYLRFQFQGTEINGELSFVKPKLSSLLYNKKEKNCIEKVMTQLGDKIVSNSFSEETKQILKEHPKQIVAISDLPVEWLPIDGVPLGFSHDVCRISEFPLEGILTHYALNSIRNLTIPKDILNHTLVIYGTHDDSFVVFQKLCDQSAQELNFTTKACNNKDEFYQTIHTVKPLFLIIDSHGGFDEITHETYLYMGNDKVYPQDLINNKIRVPLVFLSACNTAPTYHITNPLANGFIQSGSHVVTSSYLPLEVSESSTIYLRILKQLSVASTKGIHKNWLSFISHILRTSYIHKAFSNFYKNMKRGNDETEVAKYLTRSMIFHERRQVYKEIHEGFTMGDINVKLSHEIPHYLMYSTIGRADLITFESYREKLSNDLRELFNLERS